MAAVQIESNTCALAAEGGCPSSSSCTLPASSSSASTTISSSGADISASKATTATTTTANSAATTATTATTETAVEPTAASVQQPLTFTVSLQLQIRPLDASDFHKNFFPLLEQLSDVGHISQEFFADQLKRLHADSSQQMLVCEDVSLGRVVATGTMVVEPKFIHSASYVGHLEDLVVDHALRAKGLGQRLVAQLMEFARAKQCYKVIVDCSEQNVGFYEKCGFKRKEMSMACYFSGSAIASTATAASALVATSSGAATVSAAAAATSPLTVTAPVEAVPERRASFGAATLERMSVDESDVLADLQQLKLREPEVLDGLTTRLLAVGDYDLGFLPLLGQLTTVGEISREAFEERVNAVHRDPFQHIMVIVDPEKGVVAAGTLLLERKFIHAGGLAGHIEDVVVDETIRGKGLGKRIVETLRNLGRDAGCYKVVLDCAKRNQTFYEKCGFRVNHSPVCMACYF